MEKGYVYILINPAFKENWVKIGSTKDVETRRKQLSGTGLPLPFETYAWCSTTKYVELEKLIHSMIEMLNPVLKVAPNREFYQIVPSKALEILTKCAAAFDDAEISTPGVKASPKKSQPQFRFSMAHVKPGDTIIFEPTGIEVQVVESKTDNQIEYEGKRYSMSRFCTDFMPESRKYASGAYQGPTFFSFRGEILSNLRAKYEKQ